MGKVCWAAKVQWCSERTLSWAPRSCLRELSRNVTRVVPSRHSTSSAHPPPEGSQAPPTKGAAPDECTPRRSAGGDLSQNGYSLSLSLSLCLSFLLLPSASTGGQRPEPQADASRHAWSWSDQVGRYLYGRGSENATQDTQSYHTALTLLQPPRTGHLQC